MLQMLFNLLWSKPRTRTSLTRELGMVRQGKRYRATVNLSWSEAMFGTNEMIRDKLVEAGFSDVKVSGAGNKRIVEALWPGPDRSGEIDSHLSDITEFA